MEENTILKISKDFSISIEKNNAIVLSLKEGWYIKLNSAGRYIVRKIMEKDFLSFKLLLIDFKKEYNLSEREARKDLKDFLNILIKEGIVLND